MVLALQLGSVPVLQKYLNKERSEYCCSSTKTLPANM